VIAVRESVGSGLFSRRAQLGLDAMTDAEFQAHLTALRRFGPTWANLRIIGNSRPVQIATVFPVVGYFILLSTRVTGLIDGGIAGTARGSGLIDAAWSYKLYCVYFGLISLGIGSAIYQLRCPREVRKYSDREDFVLNFSSAVNAEDVKFMSLETVPIPGLISTAYMKDDYRLPIMKNFYALKSAERPISRLLTSVFFIVGFALLAVPSLLTLAKVARLLGRQALG
jgi:hypothetical protein